MPCTAPGSNAAAPWGGPAAAAMHWRHESAPPQTPQHGRRRVGSPPAPCVLGGPSSWAPARQRALPGAVVALPSSGSRVCRPDRLLHSDTPGTWVSLQAPVPKAEAPAAGLPSARALCPLVPGGHLLSLPQAGPHFLSWASAPHFMTQQHPCVSLCHRWAVPMGKACTSSPTNCGNLGRCPDRVRVSRPACGGRGGGR